MAARSLLSERTEKATRGGADVQQREVRSATFAATNLAWSAYRSTSSKPIRFLGKGPPTPFFPAV